MSIRRKDKQRGRGIRDYQRTGLNALDEAFGLSPVMIDYQGVGDPYFDDKTRQKRRKKGRAAKQARKVNRGR